MLRETWSALDRAASGSAVPGANLPSKIGSYLASGRPVVIQDTGFSDWLPSGCGVMAFSTPEEAASAIEDVNSRYEYHCREARQVAESYFDARRVLTELIDSAMRSHD